MPSASDAERVPVVIEKVSAAAVSVSVMLLGAVTIGVSFTAATVTVLMEMLLLALEALPSLTWKLTVRLVVLGFSLLLA